MLRLYMDVHVAGAITRGLQMRGVDVLTAWADGSERLPDSELLERATRLGRVLFTQDDDLIAEAAERQRSGTAFSGVIYAHQLGITIGSCVADRELMAQVLEPGELRDQVWFLPLR